MLPLYRAIFCHQPRYRGFMQSDARAERSLQNVVALLDDAEAIVRARALKRGETRTGRGH